MDEIKKFKAGLLPLIIALIAVSVVMLFLPIITFTGTVEVGGKVVETLTAKASMFDILTNRKVEIMSSLNSEFTKLIDIEQIVGHSAVLSAIVSNILTLGILTCIVVSIFVQPSKPLITCFAILNLLSVVLGVIPCLVSEAGVSILKNINFSGFAAEISYLTLVIYFAGDMLISFFIVSVIDKIRVKSFTEFINYDINMSEDEKMQLIANFGVFAKNIGLGINVSIPQNAIAYKNNKK